MTQITDTVLPIDAQPEPTCGSISGAARATPAVPSPETTHQAFERLVVEHQAVLLRYARHLLGNGSASSSDDAQDAVQDAFLRLHRQWARAGQSSVAQPQAWLFRVTHNLAMDMIRKRSRTQLVKLRLSREPREQDRQHRHEPASQLLNLENREAVELAMRLMRELPDSQQHVLVLRLEDLSIRQIGQMLDMTPGNVGYHLNQALTTLAKQLKQADVV